MAQLWPWATCVTITSRFTVSIILVVITTVEERRVVAILLLHSNITSVGILIRHWIERTTKVLLVVFAFAPMARERRWLNFASCDVSTLLPQMLQNRHRHANINDIRIVTPQRRGQRKSQTYRRPIDRPIDRLSIAMGQNKLSAYCLSEQPSGPGGYRGARIRTMLPKRRCFCCF